MSEDKQIRHVASRPSHEGDGTVKHGLVNDVVVPIVASGVAGAVGGAVGAHVANVVQDPPSESPPDPPRIELPPGVDPD